MADEMMSHMADQEGAKRAAEEESQSGGSQHPSNKKARGEGSDGHFGKGEGPEVTLRFLIQSKSAGPIIGKSGLNIKRLRSEYTADVKIPDCNGPERVLTLTGKTGDLTACLEDLMPCLNESGPRGRRGPQQRNDGEDSEARLLVHQSSAGAIIGRAGFKIKELRDKSHAQIKVYSECCPNSFERVVQFNGPVNVVVDGIRETLKVIHDAPIKGPVQLYDPYCHNTRNYGGHGDGMGRDGPPPYGSFQMYNRMGGPEGQRRGGPPPHMSLRGGRRNGAGGGSSSGGGGGGRFGGGGGGPPRSRQRGDGFDFSRDRGMEDFSFEGSSYSKDYQGDEEEGDVSSTQVTIPNDLAGAIIGHCGERISEIRRKSGAKIKIAEPLPGADERIITITGNKEGITNAQYLLQHSVRNFSKSSY